MTFRLLKFLSCFESSANITRSDVQDSDASLTYTPTAFWFSILFGSDEIQHTLSNTTWHQINAATSGSVNIPFSGKYQDHRLQSCTSLHYLTRSCSSCLWPLLVLVRFTLHGRSRRPSSSHHILRKLSPQQQFFKLHVYRWLDVLPG